MTAKVRRVDFWPDEWLGGTSGLSDAQCGIYIRACALIYSNGGPITRADLRDACTGRGTRFWTALDMLIQRGKLVALDNDRLDQVRCEAELTRARRRIEAAKDGARARWDDLPEAHNGHTTVTQSSHKRHTKSTRDDPKPAENNDFPDATAYANGQPRTKNKDKEDSKRDSGLGSACAREGARETSTPPPTPPAGDAIPLDELVEVVKGNLVSPRNGIHDPVAYRKAIRCSKRERWLNDLATWVGTALDGISDRMAAWEAIEQRRACGTGAATPPDIRRAVDALSRLRDSQQQHAEAAE